MVVIPKEWIVDGLSRIRDIVNGIPPEQAPTTASLVAGPSLRQLLDSDAKAKSLLLSSQAESICVLPAHKIVDAIKHRELTAVQVTEAFLLTAAIAHQATGCLSDFFPQEARKRASELDTKQQRREQLGLLHGLPMSLKGHLFLAGHRNQNGFALDMLSQEAYDALLSDQANSIVASLSRAHLSLLKSREPRTSTEDGVLVQILREQGAVFYCKTTMPQSVMHLDTRSKPFGQTLNPHNLALSAGGSSGGEAALLAAGGSPLGVGTDIGGSVRQPCAVTGLWGLRPTCGRLPSTSSLAPTPGNAGVISTVGPMGRSLRDVDLFMAAVLEGEPWRLDHHTYRLPWRSDAVWARRRETIRIGVLKTDGVVRPVAPIRRALADVVARLEKSDADVQLVEVNVGDLHARAWDLIRSLYYFDGGAFTRILAELGDEPLLPLTEHILKGVKERSAHEIWELTLQREQLKREYLRWWNEQGVHAILCPAAVTVAPRPGTMKYWGYTSAFNLFDLPSLVFPTSINVDARLDEAFEASEGLDTGRTSDVLGHEVEEEYLRHRLVYEGAPVGLQLVGSRFEEEELLQVMSVLEKALSSAP